jgi:hypothetical protein
LWADNQEYAYCRIYSLWFFPSSFVLTLFLCFDHRVVAILWLGPRVGQRTAGGAEPERQRDRPDRLGRTRPDTEERSLLHVEGTAAQQHWVGSDWLDRTFSQTFAK